MTDDGTAAVRDVVVAFFATFVSGPECIERAERLRGLCLPGAIIVSGSTPPVVEDIESFLAPRLALLTGGGLSEFREWPEEGWIDVHGDLAHWFGPYAKQGRRDGVAFEGRGAKSIQLVRTPAGWRISAVAWSDDPADRARGTLER